MHTFIRIFHFGTILYYCGTCLLFNGKENAPKVKEWARNMEQEIVGKIDKVKDMTEPVLAKIIDKVKEKYEQMKDVDKEELKKTVDTLRDHWSEVIKSR